ncbi:hypothetical protein J6Q66_06235 [bacterium]|nr:hypothetical protein [bacterium]
MRINTQYQTELKKTRINQQTPQKFEGVGDALTNALTLCDAYPMVGVSVIDGATSIVPRTIIDAQTHRFAALETFRRESFGLIVNCLIPSFIVLGVGKLLQKAVLGKEFKHLDMANVWANQDNIEMLGNKFKQANASNALTKNEEFVKSVLYSTQGLDGKNYKKFADYDLSSEIKTLAKCIDSNDKNSKKVIQSVYKSIVDKTKAAETLKIDGKETSSNLSMLLRDTVALGKKFNDGKVIKNLDGFKKVAIKLLNTKSLAGMGIIIPLAMSVQPINRMITRKNSGVKGAPIYKDFTDKDKKITINHDKEELLKSKFVSGGILTGLTILSSLKMPSLKMFQFEGLFPTMNQCRWISNATFVSRVFASEDKNELRETTIRDGLTFASLYFLGDYISKGLATIIEKVNPKVKLLNHKVQDDSKNIFQKAKNWVTNTKLKSFDEVTGKSTKNLRSLCQISHLGVAMVLLGIVFPKMLRAQTEKNREKELSQLQLEQTGDVKNNDKH